MPASWFKISKWTRYKMGPPSLERYNLSKQLWPGQVGTQASTHSACLFSEKPLLHQYPERPVKADSTHSRDEMWKAWIVQASATTCFLQPMMDLIPPWSLGQGRGGVHCTAWHPHSHFRIYGEKHLHPFYLTLPTFPNSTSQYIFSNCSCRKKVFSLFYLPYVHCFILI